MYALDLDGNWMWGNFFYNVSYAVSDVTACHLSSKESYVTVLGIANAKPIAMFLNKNEGNILKFVTLDYYDSTTPAPSFTTA